MKRKQIVITIDQEILKESRAASANGCWRFDSCPIALDLRRQGFKNATVGITGFAYDTKNGQARYPLSKTAKDFLLEADEKKDIGVKSRRFHLIDSHHVRK